MYVARHVETIPADHTDGTTIDTKRKPLHERHLHTYSSDNPSDNFASPNISISTE